MINDNTPIIVGVGQITEQPGDLASASSPIDLMVQAANVALNDAGIDAEILSKLDQLAVVRSFREYTDNTAECLARRLGAADAECWMMPNGGNGPQYLVNRYFESIARGESHFVLLSGSEAMNNSRRIVKSGSKPDWNEAVEQPARYLVADKVMSSDHEKANGVYIASSVYPLFENALRHHYGRSIDEHQMAMGELFSKFSAVAANAPTSWYSQAYTAQEIAEANNDNRYVGWPYTKRMNAMNQINQSATLLLCSVAFARSAGIDEGKWVYLHGCADVNEREYMSDRVNYFSSPAIKVMGRETLSMAGKRINDIDYFDIYSCFPSAVQIARDELGIAASDPRPLTITGGLPFHGGAGNNYVMNAIASMIEKVRHNRGQFGMVTANGGYLSKHAAGIYSTAPVEGKWVRRDPATYQREVDELVSPSIEYLPNGAAIIETYTVEFGRDNTPNSGIVIGRLGNGDNPMASRFVARLPEDQDLLWLMTQQDCVGIAGSVKSGDPNIFIPLLN